MYSWDYAINHNENEDENVISNVKMSDQKYISHRYDLNRPMSKNGHRYSEYKKWYQFDDA